MKKNRQTYNLTQAFAEAARPKYDRKTGKLRDAFSATENICDGRSRHRAGETYLVFAEPRPSPERYRQLHRSPAQGSGRQPTAYLGCHRGKARHDGRRNPGASPLGDSYDVRSPGAVANGCVDQGPNNVENIYPEQGGNRGRIEAEPGLVVVLGSRAESTAPNGQRAFERLDGVEGSRHRKIRRPGRKPTGSKDPKGTYPA